MNSQALRVKDKSPILEIAAYGPLTFDKKLSREEFLKFAERYPGLIIEREKNGKTTIMSPLKFGSGFRESIISAYLGKWWLETRKGKIFSASTGVELGDTSIKSPDCGWVSDERFSEIPEGEADGNYLQVAPDFIVEIKSRSDSMAKLKRKMVNSWMKNGVRLAWLIDPYKEQIFIYREGQEVETFKGFDDKIVTGENVVPDFSMPLSEMKI